MSTSHGQTLGVLPYTWAGAPGVGPSRERTLWAAGGWNHGDVEGAVARAGLPAGVLPKLLGFTRQLQNLLEKADFEGIFRLLPTRERWRVLPMVLHRAVGVDIETDGTELTAMSVFGPGVAVAWAPGLGPPPLEALEGASAVLTYNGAAFDVPIISRVWPQLRWPLVHVDVRSMTRRMTTGGGLKALEKTAGWERPASIDGLDGSAAGGLWRAWATAKHRPSLEKLLEYNMEDAFSLPYLAAWCHDRLVGRALGVAPEAPRPAPLVTPELTRVDQAPRVTQALLTALKLAG